jgi:hypothetical protein
MPTLTKHYGVNIMSYYKIKSFKEYTKDIDRDVVEIELISDGISSQKLIELLQRLQKEHNTTDLSITTRVLDSYYESSEIVISRAENDTEYKERITRMYNYYVAKENIAKENYEKEQALSKLMKQQQELQKQIDALN